jgi:murein L,D-transpeptidase YafK
MTLLFEIIASLCALAPSADSISYECNCFDARIVVETSIHRLVLCESTSKVNEYAVNLGRGGVGKTREGDGKVPLGTYQLGSPRPSQNYRTFIPIGYPTAQQMKEGYTGGSIGLHGPPRRYKWLGRLLMLFDLTEGCVELATDAEIEQIAAWVQKTGARFIEIR